MKRIKLGILIISYFLIGAQTFVPGLPPPLPYECTETIICKNCNPGLYPIHSSELISEIRVNGITQYVTYIDSSRFSGWAMWKIGHPELSICVAKGLKLSFLPLINLP